MRSGRARSVLTAEDNWAVLCTARGAQADRDQNREALHLHS
jgi:hypothetical protein